ncbi:glycosyltransferase [Promicromonospora thailandica]|nr:glycosyltransferase [Promicromonospora thailandica]
MTSVLIASVPIHGHVAPLLTVARQLVERGDDVRFLTGARFADVVAATGARHVALPPDADLDDRQDFNETFPERAALRGPRAAAHDIEHVFVRPGRPQHDAVMELHAAEPVDVLLTDPAFLGGALLAGHPAGVRPPLVVGGVFPLMISSRDTAPFSMGLPPVRGPLGRLRNAALAALVDRTVFARSREIVDDMYRDLHGRPFDTPVFDWPRHADAIVQFTVPEFEYPRSDAPANLRFAGALPASGTAAPLPDWWGDLDGSRPVVHVTQGTIANKDFGQLVAPALEALADEDVLVVVATGGRPLDTLPPLPGNARAAELLPYDELLPRTDAYVTNGGYGGVQLAMRYGVPIVATGGHEDKPEVGARVAWSGVGVRFRAERVAPRALRRAVRRVLSDSAIRTASRAMAARMAESDGMRVLTEVLDGLSAAQRTTRSGR